MQRNNAPEPYQVVRHAIKLAEAAEDGGVPAELAALLESLSL